MKYVTTENTAPSAEFTCFISGILEIIEAIGFKTINKTRIATNKTTNQIKRLA